MVQPKFRRFWIRILPNGAALPQFDHITGKYCGYETYRGLVAQILFYPVTPRLASLITKQGDVAEASNLRSLMFDISPGVPHEFHRVGNLHLDPMRICGLCEAEFDPSLRKCPRCLAKNQWYCGKCDELKETPIVDFELQNKDGDKRTIRIPPALWSHAHDVVKQIPGWGIKSVHERCPDCEKTDPRGVRSIKCVGDFTNERIFTHYELTIGGQKHIVLDYSVNSELRHERAQKIV
jgi:hypothetical protein